MQDNNVPLIPIACFDAIIHHDPADGTHPPGTQGVTPLVERLLPCLWANICALRNVNGNGKIADKKYVLVWKRQALIHLLAL